VTSPSLLRSYFMGGFECSTQRRRGGVRLDLLHATGHDLHAEQDYRTLTALGIASIRDGLRWHLIEQVPGRYEWSSFLPMLRAARAAKVQVVWDLCHYGWPDDIDIWSDEFPDRYARFAAAAAQVVRDETPDAPFYCPMNEISFWAWAGGDMRLFAPFAERRGMELKRQLARAAIAGIRAIRSVDPRARIINVDPVIHVATKLPHARRQALRATAAQYEAWDMLAGSLDPELGGSPDCLDILGVNYYSNNQWFLRGRTIKQGHALYRPFRDILAEVHQRYERPIIVAETGAEGEMRRPWFSYVCDEVFEAVSAGVPVQGICLYPVTDYPGWVDRRHCDCGLLGVPDAHGSRALHAPLAEELAFQRQRFQAVLRKDGDGARPDRGVDSGMADAGQLQQGLPSQAGPY
jgi:beta-glucosidase/6-phospho-beta-glucosidase/beta-galactosidase